ncbi:MAG: PEP-CTERM system TPR-repeat protein PrsT [Gammaproteobacteria bacterium]|nr:PEP-CTERM system TPR-repeat protein PrsT [Gammaproteobacteria bacterium]MBU1554097.1 PEP-CTERM system TPR-repeat protein PrsT [Gammaproteobacteria bacterium]
MRCLGKDVLYFICLFAPAVSLAGPNEDFEKAIQAFNQTEANAAYIHLKNVLQQAPEHIPAKVLMGKVLLNKGYFNEAITEFEEALDNNADIASMLEELATAYLFAGKNEQVLSLGQRYQLAPAQRFDWHLLSAAAQLNMGNIDAAEAQYTAASKLQSESLRLLNSKAALRLKQRNYDEANDLITQALNIDAANPQSLQLRAEWLQLNGNAAAAQQFYEQATELSPQDPLLRRALLRNYVSQQKLDLAEQTIQHILQFTPDDPYALLLAAWLSAIKPQAAAAENSGKQLSDLLWKMSRQQIEAQPSRLYSRALLSYVEGSYEKARSDLHAYLPLAPADLNAVAILARIYMRQNDVNAAIQLLEQHLSHLNAMPELAQLLTTLYITTNKTNKAEQLIASLRLQYPDNAEFAVLHAAVLKKLTQNPQAQQLIKQFEQQHGASLLITTNQALFALESGDFDTALTLANQLLQQAPQNSGYLNFKAAVLIKLQQADAAKVLLQQILQQEPGHLAAQFNLAQIALSEQNNENAIALLEPVVKANQSYKPAPTLLALAYIRSGRLSDAETLLLDTTAVVPYPPADSMLFDLYMQQQKYQDALSIVDKGLERKFLHEPLLWKKAQLLKLLSRNDEAIYQTELLQSLVQDDADKLLRLALLQRELGNSSASEQSLLAAQQSNAKSRLIQLELVNHYLLTEQPLQAEKWLRRLQPYAATDANITMLSADLALLNKDTNKAVLLFKQALRLDPAFQLVWVKLYQLAKNGVDAKGFSLLAQDNLRENKDFNWLRRLLAEHFVNQQQATEAIQQYEILLAAGAYTDDVAVHNNLANLYLPTDAKTALSYAETAVKLAPKHAAALDTYGWILTKTGSYQQALAVLRQANTLDAAEPATRFHLAYTLAQLQRKDEAKTILRQLLADTATFSEKNAAEALLQQL